jgi:hypothetical protein
MDDFFVVFYLLWVAVVSTVLFLLIEKFPSPKIKIVLPLICGLSLFFFTTVLTINYGPLFLLKILVWPLLLPSFVIAFIPLLEKKDGVVFEKFFVFFGALTALILYCLLTQIVLNLGDTALYGKSILWNVVLLAISGFVFCGILHIQRFNSECSQEKYEKMETLPNNSASSTEIKRLIFTAAILLILISPYFLLFVIGSL